jgi:hypothetical protein
MRSRDRPVQGVGRPGVVDRARRSEMRVRRDVDRFPWWLVTAWAVSLGVGLVVLFVWVRGRTRAATLLLDPTAAAGVEPWFGAASMVGVLAWTVAAIALLLAGSVLHALRRDCDRATCFVRAGVLVAVVALDDAFLVHEHWLPHHLGIPDPVTFAGYGLAVGVLVMRHRSVVRTLAWMPYVAAAGALALSMILDVWFDGVGHRSGATAFEDLPKLWGAVLVALGASRDAFRAVVRAT